MRTLTWMVPIPFTGWLIFWAYESVGNAYWGIGFIGLMLVNLVMLGWAIFMDASEERDRRRAKEDE